MLWQKLFHQLLGQSTRIVSLGTISAVILNRTEVHVASPRKQSDASMTPLTMKAALQSPMVASHPGTSWSLQKAAARHSLVPSSEATKAKLRDGYGYGCVRLRGGLHQMRLENQGSGDLWRWRRPATLIQRIQKRDPNLENYPYGMLQHATSCKCQRFRVTSRHECRRESSCAVKLRRISTTAGSTRTRPFKTLSLTLHGLRETLRIKCPTGWLKMCLHRLGKPSWNYKPRPNFRTDFGESPWLCGLSFARGILGFQLRSGKFAC